MKVLRTILIILGLLLLIAAILTMVAPTKFSIKRSAVINAPREVVFANISTFENLHK